MRKRDKQIARAWGSRKSKAAMRGAMRGAIFNAVALALPIALAGCAAAPGMKMVKPATIAVSHDTEARAEAAPVPIMNIDATLIHRLRATRTKDLDEAVRELTKKGFRASRLTDGFPEWRRAGLPVAVGEDL